jgi:aspartate carbamoyltransferase catalytic subunit
LDRKFVASLEVPVINAGDGYNSHPTQAIGDVATLSAALGPDLDNASIGILGATNLRTIRSLEQVLHRISSAKFIVIDEKPTHRLAENSTNRIVVASKAELLTCSDVVYVSGFEHADFSSARTSPRNSFQTPLLLESDVANSHRRILIMHPGPKTHDLDPALDQNANNLIWKQARYATTVRKLLLSAYINS